MKRTLLALVSAIGLAVLFAAPNASGAVGDDSPPIFVGERSETYQIGPFQLAAQGQPGDQINQIFAQVDRPQGDIAIRSIEWSLVDGDGNALGHEDAHLHHVVFLDSGRPDALCGGFGSRFAGTGTELTDFVLPSGYAYRSPANSHWQSVHHIMNRSPVARTVAVEYTVTYSDGRNDDYDDVDPHFFDVDGCWGDSEFDVPGDGGPDSVFEKSKTYNMYRDAILVAGGGHVHAGGIDLTLTGPSDDQICRSHAVYNDHGHLVRIEPCGQVDHAVDAGDEVTLTARYENDEPIDGAMGIMVMYVHYTGPPPPPPTLDIEVTGVDRDGIAGTVTCNVYAEAEVYGQVSQEKGGVRISGYGYDGTTITCGPDATPFTLALSGNGVLTGGTVDYIVEGYAFSGRDYVSDFVSGSTHMRGRLDLAPDLTDQGPTDVALDGAIEQNTDGSFTVPISVPCDDSTTFDLSVTMLQRFGLQHLQGYGYDYGEFPCIDGKATSSVVVSAYGQRFASGPVVVQASMYEYSGDYSFSQRSFTTRIVSSLPPVVDTATEFDPSSPVRIDDVIKRGDDTVALVTIDDCPAGSEAYIDVMAEADTGRGRRSSGPSAWGYSYAACAGGPIQIEVLLQPEPSANRVHAALSVYIQDQSSQYVQETNGGSFRVGR